MRQRVKRYSVGSFALVVVLAGVGKLSLASDYAAREAVARIQAAVGAPVRCAGVDLGYSCSALRGVEVLENATTSAPPAWTSARAIEADLSLWQLLRGALAGGTVTVHDAAVTLRFDRNNHLLTRLPTPPPTAPVELPLVRLEGGTFTLQREGVPDEVFHNIHLELRGDGDRLSFAGTIDDPDWGPWTVTGGRDSASEPFTLILRTAKEVHATPELLRRAPFVPPVTWRQVELEGDTTCELTLRFEPGGHVRYRAVLDPHDTKVHVTSIDLRAEKAQGRVVVEDGVVTLENVRGRAAGGAVTVGSTMDFRGGQSVLRYAVEVSEVIPRLLPKRWPVPPLGGQVNGRADLVVTVRDGRATTRGRGEGTMKLPLLPPMRLRLEADESGFHLHRGQG
jgi:hypothetical protein